MADQSGTAGHTLMQQMGITTEDIEQRKRVVGLRPGDLARIAAIKDTVAQNCEQHTSQFFDFLASLEEARPLFANREMADRARRLKSEHIAAMVQGDYGTKYVEQRIELGLIYSKVALDHASSWAHSTTC